MRSTEPPGGRQAVAGRGPRWEDRVGFASMRGARHAISGLLVPLVALAAGCAGSLTKTDDGWRNARHGYTIARPGGANGDWHRIDVEGAVLAFQRSPGETVSMQTRCGRPVASAELMARHLVIGFRDRRLVAAGPIVVDGRGGWAQAFDTASGERTVRVKTVTLVVGDCAFDWILAVRGPMGSVEQAFDAWWQSFRLDPERWAGVSG